MSTAGSDPVRPFVEPGETVLTQQAIWTVAGRGYPPRPSRGGVGRRGLGCVLDFVSSDVDPAVLHGRAVSGPADSWAQRIGAERTRHALAIAVTDRRVLVLSLHPLTVGAILGPVTGAGREPPTVLFDLAPPLIRSARRVTWLASTARLRIVFADRSWIVVRAAPSLGGLLRVRRFVAAFRSLGIGPD
ncbi:MAG: hypothetical protein ACK5OX_12660 [Desertimonas sp.]